MIQNGSDADLQRVSQISLGTKKCYRRQIANDVVTETVILHDNDPKRCMVVARAHLGKINSALNEYDYLEHKTKT